MMSDKQSAGIGKGTPGPGRPKGSPNKTTALLKDAILRAAAEAGNGDMTAYLKAQALANPQAFLPLLGKVLPLQVVGDSESPIEINVTIGGNAGKPEA